MVLSERRDVDDLPRYQQITHALIGQIVSGRYSINASLPTESELRAEFDASRFTVREALRRLVDQGMAQRGKARAASTLRARRNPATYTHSARSLSCSS